MTDEELIDAVEKLLYRLQHPSNGSYIACVESLRDTREALDPFIPELVKRLREANKQIASLKKFEADRWENIPEEFKRARGLDHD